jgi:hypothetical protein
VPPYPTRDPYYDRLLQTELCKHKQRVARQHAIRSRARVKTRQGQQARRAVGICGGNLPAFQSTAAQPTSTWIESFNPTTRGWGAPAAARPRSAGATEQVWHSTSLESSDRAAHQWDGRSAAPGSRKRPGSADCSVVYTWGNRGIEQSRSLPNLALCAEAFGHFRQRPVQNSSAAAYLGTEPEPEPEPQPQVSTAVRLCTCKRY